MIDADIPDASSLTADMNYQLQVNTAGVNSWQPITETTVSLDLNDLDDVIAIGPSNTNLLQFNAAERWVNATVDNVWNDGFAATTNNNAMLLRTATDPVFTDTNTTYNINTEEGVAGLTAFINLGVGSLPTGTGSSRITIRAGNNISVTEDGNTIDIAAPGFGDVQVFDSVADRNADTTTEWHQGDLAIVNGDNSYFYVGSDGVGPTDADDWQMLVTPSTALDAMGVLNQLNMNDGSTGGINDSLISSNIQRTSSAVTTSSSITALSDVSYNAPALPNPLPNTFLIWDDTNNRWTNSSNDISDFLSVTVNNLQTRLGQIADETIPLT